MRTLILIILALLAFSAPAFADSISGATTPDADADSDTDTDADADADSDTDTDVVAPAPESKKLERREHKPVKDVKTTTTPGTGVDTNPKTPPRVGDTGDSQKLVIRSVSSTPSYVIPCNCAGLNPCPCTSRTTVSTSAAQWGYLTAEATGFYQNQARIAESADRAQVAELQSYNQGMVAINGQQQQTVRQAAVVQTAELAAQLNSAGAAAYYLEVTPTGGLILDVEQPRFSATSEIVGGKTTVNTGDRVRRYGILRPGMRNTSAAGWIAASCIALAGGASGFVLGAEDDVAYTNDGVSVVETHTTEYGLRSGLLGAGGAALGFTAVSFAF